MKTAYQIADELEERNAPYEDDAANFIRQQQAEIEKWTDQYQRLNENLEMWKAGHFKQQAEIKALRMMLANRNDALDKLELK